MSAQYIPASQGGPKDGVKLIAYYLTQFHPIPENDAWWGKGFTEWTNATKAVPQFRGHYQPHLPTDLGFYDLRLRETQLDQIKLAKEYGIGGFCYYYYWFSGRKILERPLEAMLNDLTLDMPFCLCWANENWSRRWDATDTEVLLAQKYGPDDDLEFIKSLIPYLKDPRYIRYNDAPLILVYRPQHLPDAKKSCAIWREYCAQNGIPKIEVRCAFTHGNWSYEQFGFDGGVEFPPHNMTGRNLRKYLDWVPDFKGSVFDMTDVGELYLSRDYRSYNAFRGICPSWDNTARRGAMASVGVNGTPENYEFWLSEAVRKTREDYPGQEAFVFINAWNEWAEGCHLEPDRKYQRKFLEVTARVMNGASEVSSWASRGAPADLRLSKLSRTLKSWRHKWRKGK
jgi:lipopolysaccharide biosynthesis protein